MNILILGNTAGLTNDFILKTFPNQAVFIVSRKPLAVLVVPKSF